MSELDPAEIAHHAARMGTDTRVLISVTAKNRDTGEPETLRLWNGDDHEEFTVDGELNTYYAAGNVIGIGDLVSEVGLNVQMQSMTLSAVSPEVELLFRGYDARLAPTTIHRVVRDLKTGNLVADPRRIFKGVINKAPIATPAIGGSAEVKVTLASAARGTTRTLTLKRSDAAMRLRNPNDPFRKYADTSAEVEVSWGELKASTSKTTATAEVTSTPSGSASGGGVW